MRVNVPTTLETDVEISEFIAKFTSNTYTTFDFGIHQLIIRDISFDQWTAYFSKNREAICPSFCEELNHCRWLPWFHSSNAGHLSRQHLILIFKDLIAIAKVSLFL